MQSQSGIMPMLTCDVQYTMCNAYNIQCAIVQSVMQAQSGGLSMQFCDVHYTMCNVYNIQCAILQSVMQSQSGLLPMQCVMQNVQCAVCDVHFLLRSWKSSSACVMPSLPRVFTTFLQESSIPSTYSRAKPTVLQCSWYFWLPSRKFTFLVLCFDEVVSTSGT